MKDLRQESQRTTVGRVLGVIVLILLGSLIVFAALYFAVVVWKRMTTLPMPPG